MGYQYSGDLCYVARFSNGVIMELSVLEGFRKIYEAIRSELRSSVGCNIYYTFESCDVYIAYVVERRDIKLKVCRSQYSFEKKIGYAFASCIDKVTHFEFFRCSDI